MTDDFTVRLADWQADAEAISTVREAVFIREQGVPAELEWDDLDADCVQVLALSGDNRPIGTGRLLADGRIGRMAVLPAWRGKGVGKAMLQALLDEARERGISGLFLHAQTSATGFYERFGFRMDGEPFEEAGIPHCVMIRHD